jgi:hypothetical protein
MKTDKINLSSSFTQSIEKQVSIVSKYQLMYQKSKLKKSSNESHDVFNKK